VLPALLAPLAKSADVVPAESKVSWIHRASDEFQLKVEAAQSSALVVGQIYYPGWKAWIDGEPARVVNANYALTGIVVPPGVHDVRFRFDPASFKFGLFISLASVVVLIWGEISRGLHGLRGFRRVK
jgi:uncharacterized membrane protein YfhO